MKTLLMNRMELFRNKVKQQYRKKRFRIPSILLPFTDKSDWRFKRTFLLLLQQQEKVGLEPVEAFLIACKLRGIWIEDFFPIFQEHKMDGRVISDLGLRIPLFNTWRYWVSIRNLVTIPIKTKNDISRALFKLNNLIVDDIQAFCAVIAYREAHKTQKISQIKIAEAFKIPISRFRNALSSYDNNNENAND